MKKIVKIVSALALTLSLFGCGKSNITKNGKTTTNIVDESKLTVSFDTDKGSIINPQTVDKGSTISKPADPTKDGFAFCGWYFHGDKWDFNKPINENMTLFAHWADLSYSHIGGAISDNPEGGYVLVNNEKVTDYNYYENARHMTILASAYDGYKFMGWYDEYYLVSNQGNYSYDMPNRDYKLVAKFIPNDGSVGFISFVDPNNPTIEGRVFVEKGHDYKMPVPKSDDKVFLGWYCGDRLTDGYGNSLSPYDYEYSLYATPKWRGEFAIYYYINNDVMRTYLNYGEDYKLPVPEEDGKEFIGWYYGERRLTDEFGNSLAPYNYKYDISISEKWVGDPGTKDYYIVYFIDGYAYTFEIDDGDNYKLPVPEEEGKEFIGWYRDDVKLTDEKGESLVPYNFGSNITVYSKWETKPEPVSNFISYEINGNEKQIKVTFGEDYQLPVPEEEGKVFFGWYYGNRRVTNESGRSLTPYNYEYNIKVTAKWVGDSGTKDYYIFYFINDHGYTIEIDDGEDYKLPVPEEEGKEFIGWYKDGVKLTDENGNSLVPYDFGSNITVNPKWETNPETDFYFVSFEINGIENQIKVTFGEDYQLPVPEEEGKVFYGWCLEDTRLTDENGDSLVPYNFESNITVTAKWVGDPGTKDYFIFYYIDGIKESIGVNNGEDYKLPKLEGNGIVFGGWYKDNTKLTDENGDSLVPYNYGSDITVTPKWKANSDIKDYSIFYVLNDVGMICEIDSGDSYKLQVPVEAGKEFVGWYYQNTKLTDENGDSLVPYNYENDITATPKWVGDAGCGFYYISFADSNGTLVSVKVEYNKSYKLPTKSRLIGDVFYGWYDNDRRLTDENGDSYVPYDYEYSINVFPKFIGDSGIYAHKISYTDKDGNNQYIIIEEGNEFELPVITKEGRVFEGWYYQSTKLTDETGKSINNYSYLFDITVTPIWVGDPVEGLYKIYYNMDDGLDHYIETRLNETYIIPLPTKDNYVFGGWYYGDIKITDLAGNSLEAFNFELGINVTAKWYDEDEGYIIKTYSDLTKGSTNYNIPDFLEKGSVIEIIATPNVGYKFDGWYIGDELFSNEATYSFKLNSNLEIQAKFIEREFIITYDTCDGEIENANKSVTYLSAYVLDVPTKNKYIFEGWYYGDIKLTDKLGNSCKNYEYTSDITATAHYSKDTTKYKLTITNASPDSGKINITEGTFEGDTSITISATLKKGFVVEGWYYNDTNLGTDLSFTFDMPFYDYDLTVKFKVTPGLEIFKFSSTYDYCEVKGFNGPSVENVVIPEGVTLISSGAFSSNNVIKTVTLPTTISVLYQDSFSYCYYLTTVTCLGGLKAINSSAFEFDSSLTTVILPDSVNYIGEHAFNQCKNLTSLNMPKGLSTISSFAFTNTRFETAILSDSVTSIGEGAFLNCSKLTEIRFSNNIKSLSPRVCKGCSSLATVTLPEGIERIDYSCFEGCGSLKNINWPTTLLELGDYVFNGCGSLEEINLPVGLTKIGSFTFSGCSKIKDFTIPNTITSIGSQAFNSCNTLTEITIPNCIETFGTNIFNKCTNLKTITFQTGLEAIPEGIINECSSATTIIIPNTVISIGKNAFNNCSDLSSISIPNSVTTIGEGVFAGCTSLNNVIISNYVSEIGPSAFSGCTSLTDITLSTIITSLSNYIFDGCTSLETITIPDSVTQIGDGAFRNCSLITALPITSYIKNISSQAFAGCVGLTDVTIPATVEAIGSQVFSGCEGLSKIVIPDNITEVGEAVFDGCSNLTDVTLPINLASITKNLFRGCTSLESLDVPETVSQIGEGAFNGCVALDEISIPKDVTSIGKEAFNGCILIESITLGNVIETIGEKAFNGCTALNNVVIPSSVTGIGDYAFSGCILLDNITLSCEIESISSGMFNGCVKLTSINIPSTVKYIGANAFKGCELIETVTLSNVLGYIGVSAFEDCSSLSAIAIPDTVTEICKFAFKNCSLLASANLPSGISYVGESLFENCAKLAAIAVPENVTKINNTAFMGCTSLATFSFGGKENTIGEKAFFDCKSITAIQVPKTITKLGNNAFSNCSSLESFELLGGSVSLSYNAFNGCSSLKTVVLGSAVDVIGNEAFKNCSKLTTVTITGGLTEIGREAFRYCTMLNSITLPDTLTTIGTSAFQKCESLTSISIPGTVEYVGENTFLDCTSLKTIAINDGVKCITNGAFAYTNVEEITIPSSVTEIGYCCFIGCNSLKTLHLNEGLLTIGEAAFYDCYALEEIIIPETVTTIDVDAFRNCIAAKKVYLPSSVTEFGYLSFGGVKNAKIYYFLSERYGVRISNDPHFGWESSTLYIYSENKPTESGKYFHFDANGNIVAW